MLSSPHGRVGCAYSSLGFLAHCDKENKASGAMYVIGKPTEGCGKGDG
jgi:hypothetical protein